MTTDQSLFDWISLGSSIFSTLAVIVGLYYAYKQITVWKVDARARRRAEVAEDLLAAAHSAQDVIRSLRSPLSQVPVEEANNETYVYEQRWNRMAERSSVFETLRHAQIRAKAVLASARADEAVEEIYKARSDFMFALEMLADLMREEHPATEDRQEAKKFRKTIFGRFNEKDELNQRLVDALATLEDELGADIRLERKT